MRPTRLPLLPLLLLGSALIGATPPAARADDPAPPAGFPAPATPSAGPGALPPAAPAPSPAPAAPPSNLPPPVSRRLQGAAPAGAVAGPSAPAGESAAGIQRREVLGTGIAEVRTTEDLALTGGGSAVQLLVRFQVTGDDARHFYVNAVFFDKATGQPLSSRRAAFADPGTGTLFLICQPVVHAGGASEYEVPLQVPYDAFPETPAGTTRPVEARVTLFRRSLTGGMDESMDWTSAPLTLRGPAALPPSMPPAPPAAAPSLAPTVPGFPPLAPSVETAPVVVRATESPLPVAPPASETRLLDLTKNHNQPYPDGRLGLRLDARFQVAGQRGRAFYLHALFLDASTGRAIPTVRPAFADRATGALYVLTTPLQHDADDTAEVTLPLWVPYDAFPRPAPGTATDVEARVTLFRREPVGQDVAMDVKSTTFKVHGE